jgi:hypothetical protein
MNCLIENEYIKGKKRRKKTEKTTCLIEYMKVTKTEKKNGKKL